MKRIVLVLGLLGCSTARPASVTPRNLTPALPTVQAPAAEPPAPPPPLPTASSVDTLRASGGDDHAALDSVLRAAAARGGQPVVRLVGAFTDSSTGLWVSDGVRVEGPAEIRFTNRDLQYGAVNLGRHVAVVDLTILGPWLAQDYDPHGRQHAGFNGGGGPERHGQDVELRGVVARGFAGAGYNTGGYVDDIRILSSQFLDCGDAGVQIGATVTGYRITGSRASRNRNNGFDLTGSGGYLADDTADGNGRATVSFPDGSTDVNGFLVWAVTDDEGRHDAVGNVLERVVAVDNYGHGISLVGGGTAAVRGTTVRDAEASGNRAAAFHVQGSAPLDGAGDNRDTRIEGSRGEWLYVHHFGTDPTRSISGLVLKGNAIARVTVDNPADEQ